jgi:UDP-glucose 4-epimerase
VSGSTLVRGASGFLGRHLASRLAGGGSLRLFVRKAWRLPGYLRKSPGVEVVEGDALDESAVLASLEGVETVWDFVGATVPASHRSGHRAEVDLNLRALAILLDGMRSAGARRLVFPSSGGTIYGRTLSHPAREEDPGAPDSPYGLGKLLAEEMIRFEGRSGRLDYLILRMANPYGRNVVTTATQGVVDVFLARAHEKGSVTIWGDGSQVRDFLFVDDAVEAALAAAAAGTWRETYNVGSGAPVSISQVLALVEDVTGAPLERKTLADAYPGVSYSVLDSSKLAGRTGWAPSYSLRAGIEEAWRRLAGERNGVSRSNPEAPTPTSARA